MDMRYEIPLCQIDTSRGVSASGPNGGNCLMALRTEDGDVIAWNSNANPETGTGTRFTKAEWNSAQAAFADGTLSFDNLPVAA